MVETPLKVAESVGMMRILELCERIKMVVTQEITYAVDTPEDLEKVIEKMQHDSFKIMALVYRIYCADPEWQQRWSLTDTAIVGSELE